jgi:hypothetical protein
MRAFLSTCIVLVLFLGCSCQKKAEPEGYRVLSYDGLTRQWIILHTETFDGKYLKMRLTVVCSLYQWGDHKAVSGPDACLLYVGYLMTPNLSPPAGRDDKFLHISAAGEKLEITEGRGDNRVHQEFRILKNEVLPD